MIELTIVTTDKTEIKAYYENLNQCNTHFNIQNALFSIDSAIAIDSANNQRIITVLK
jgi:hypothetical protein